MYQISVMLAVLPYLVHQYNISEISGYTLGCGFGAATGTTGILIVMSYYFMRVIGEMKYDPDNHILGLSMLSFWGKRVERNVPFENVIQFNESQRKRGGAVQILKMEGTKDELLYSLRYGRIKDFKLLCKALKITDEDLHDFKTLSIKTQKRSLL